MRSTDFLQRCQDNAMKKQVFSTNGILDIQIQKNKPRHAPYTIHKNELEWIRALNLKAKTIKLQEENMRENSVNLG